MALLSHSLIFALSFYIVYVAFRNYHRFVTWHAVFMFLAFNLLLGEGLMVFTPDNWISKFLSRPGQVRLHWVLQISAGIFAIMGFAFIFFNKWQNNFPHFRTWHSQVGLAGLISFSLMGLSGLVTINTVKFKSWLSPARIKLGHNLFGIFVFILVQITCLLGFYTTWFSNSASYTGKIISSFMLVMSCIFTLEAPVQSAYARLKAFSQTPT